MSPKSSHQSNFEQTGEQGGRPRTGAAGALTSRPEGFPAVLRSPRVVYHSAWLVLIPAAALGFLYTWLFGVNIPWAEDWTTAVELYQHYIAGTLTFSELWKGNAEHRIFFPYLAMLGFDLLDPVNVLFYIYFQVSLLLVALSIYIYVFTRSFPSRAALWLMAPVALLMTSWRQSETLFWANCLGVVMGYVSAIATIFFLCFITDRRRLWPFAAAAVAGFVASFSFSAGLFTWPIGLLQLVFLPVSRRLKINLTLAWTALGVVAWFLYFYHGQVRPATNPPLCYSPHFFLVLLGSSVVQDENTGQLVGGLLLLLAAVAVGLVAVRRQWGRYLFWLGVMAFSLLCSASATVVRGGWGVPPTGVPPHYATLVIPLIIATYVILVSQAQERASGALWWVVGVLLGVVALCFYQSEVGEYHKGQGLNDLYRYQVYILRTLDTQPEAAMQAFVNTNHDYVRNGAAFLKEHHWSVYAPGSDGDRYAPLDPALPTLPQTTDFHIDGVSQLEGNAGYAVSGWAVDSLHQAPAGGVYLVVDGQDYPVFCELPRPDIADKFHDPSLEHCGFQRLLPPRLLPPGRHRLGLKILTHDRQALLNMPNGFDIDVK